MKQDLDKKLFEIIVIDNASTDKTSEVAEKYPTKLVHEARLGVTAARQKGVDVSQGKIIVSADADSIYPPMWLSRINKNFEKYPDVISIVGWVYFDNTPFMFDVLFALNQELNAALKRFFGKFPLVFATNFAFRRDALQKIGGYPHLPELGDQQYLLYKFQGIGRVLIDKKMYCTTSGRRHTSIISNLIIYNGWHRIFGYLVNSIFNKEVIGPAPAIRSNPFQKSRH
jgi:glycosyltransferase involved in cell wall biosynthesis